MTDRSRPRHPALAATLSFLFPGLGQAYAGQHRLALVLALPVLLLVGGALVAALLLGDRLRNEILSSSFLATALSIDVALLAWRLFAILQAAVSHPRQLALASQAAPSGTRIPGLRLPVDRTTLLTVALLAIVAVAMHAYLAVVVGRLDAALDRVFVTAPVVGAAPAENPPAPDSEPAAEGEAEERPEYRWDGTERLNFLLIGVDSGPGRDHALTDTIMVVSVDPVAREAVLVSVPRDTGFMPLPDGRIYPDGLYPDKVNSLTSVADADPELWCPEQRAASGCGIRTLERSVGLYLGITIHYYAVVDLPGFEGLIDALGGVRLCLPGRLVDREYRSAESDTGAGIELAAGCRTYSGEEALAFARIRKGTMILPDGTQEEQNDFKRAVRQQEVILALRRELAAADLFFELPGLLDAVGRTVRSDFPREKAGDLASLLPLITGPDIERVVLGAPEFADLPPEPDLNYLLTPRREDVREEAERLFGGDGTLQGWYVGSDAPGPPSATGDPASVSPAARRPT